MFVNELRKVLTGNYSIKAMRKVIDKMEEMEAELAEVREKAGLAVQQGAEAAADYSRQVVEEAERVAQTAKDAVSGKGGSK